MAQSDAGQQPGVGWGWGVSYLDQPGLQLIVYDDVVAVALEAVLVVVHHRLQRERPGTRPVSEGSARGTGQRLGDAGR